MICISIAQESRRLALADMVNASRQCDLIEVQLDRFTASPDIGELLSNKPKPMILSCRRAQDGGAWRGSEEERLTLLRQCIASKADFVEIELDVANQIRRLPPCKRVISYTNLKETPSDIAEIYNRAQQLQPDVIKLVTLARTPEEAWPLLQIQSKATIPTVIVGLARPGVMLTILGKKISAPWTYAALERGMEAYPGQPTVSDLNDVYHYPDIEKNTRLMGVTGFGDREFVLVGALNAAFRKLGEPTRCWPLGIGNAKLFRKMMDIVKLKSVAIDPNHRREMVEVMGGMEPAARQTHAVDLVVREEHEWHGYNVLWRAAGAALEGVLRQKYAKDKPLTDRVVLIVGTNETAKTALLAVKQRHAIPIVASYDKKGVQEIAKEFGCRHVLFDALYSTAHDILVVCSDEKEHAPPKAQVQGLIHPGYLKPSITVMDLTSKPRKSTLLREAQKRGCDIVEPREVLLREALLLLELTRGEGVPREFLEPVITDLIRDDD